jgi:hypothetical protein
MARIAAIVGLLGLGAAACAPFVAACSCSKVAPEPTPSASASTSAASVASLSPSAAQVDGGAPLPSVTAHTGKLERDPSGHLKPTTPMPSDDPSLVPPLPTHDPDMDLDLDDPSRDYVTRYVQATKRYGDKTDCVAYGKSYDKSGRRAVEVRDDPTPQGSHASCVGTSDALKDTFLVDVGADRLTLDSKQGHAPLAKWPDGSDPDAKAAPTASYDDFRVYKSPLVDELNKMKLTAIRVQMFGRGTYPLVSLAGWRDPLPANGKPDDVKPTTAKLCAANAGRPLSFVAGINRSTTLRVRCPSGEARWDKF